MVYVADIEADGLKPTKIHVVSVGYKDDEGNWSIKSTNDYERMRKLFTNKENTIIGHNFKLFDTPAIEKILNIKVEAEIIDTLPLAWYILPSRKTSYGLATFGEDFGIPKPKIDDWEGLSYEEYKHRCEEDVKINIKLWEFLVDRFMSVYEDPKEVKRMMRYLMFKMDCLRDQESIGTQLDLVQIQDNINLLEALRLPKELALIQAMPRTKVIKSVPTKIHKKDGSFTAQYLKWMEYLRENDYDIMTEKIYAEPNINSQPQIKDWLFSLGWSPSTYSDGANGKVPQIRTAKKELCESVRRLEDKHPAIGALDGLTVINHRLAVLKAFLDTADENGKTVSSASGFTNTLRLRHARPIANLPGVTGAIKKAIASGQSRSDAIANNLRDGQIIRECIVAPEGYQLCGSDITSLEDNTKRHYMWDYDPEYVTEQMREGFDPHLDLALKAGAITEQDVEDHVNNVKSIKHIRDMYKMANYSCIYGVGAPKLAESIGAKRKDAKKLIEAYWTRNWSVKQLSKDATTKIVGEQMWLKNPVNKFWYSLRNDKDIFSTLNQGTGAFVFDTWLLFMRKAGLKPFLQYHDEKLTLLSTRKSEQESHEKIVKDSMVKANEWLNLNVEITVDVQFGKTYADVH